MKLRRKLVFFLVIITFEILPVSLCFGQQSTNSISNGDIVQMVRAGLAESTILLAIKRGRTEFDTSPAALLELKKSGVTTQIMDVMLQSAPNSRPLTGAVSGLENTEFYVVCSGSALQAPLYEDPKLLKRISVIDCNSRVEVISREDFSSHVRLADGRDAYLLSSRLSKSKSEMHTSTAANLNLKPWEVPAKIVSTPNTAIRNAADDDPQPSTSSTGSLSLEVVQSWWQGPNVYVNVTVSKSSGEQSERWTLYCFACSSLSTGTYFGELGKKDVTVYVRKIGDDPGKVRKQKFKIFSDRDWVEPIS